MSAQITITNFQHKSVPNITKCSGCFCPVALLPAVGVERAVSEDETTVNGRKQARYYCGKCTSELDKLY